MPIDQQLAAAKRSLEGGKVDAALTSLGTAWREVPAPELLELACALSPPKPLKAAKGKETAEALAAAKKAKADPRVSKALEQLLHEVPWTADSSKPVWRAAFELVTALEDPRWVQLAESLPAQWKFRAPMVAWMQSQLKKAVAPLSGRETPSLSAAQREAVRSLLALAPKQQAAKPSGQDAAALLAAVHAAPEDDAPRRVFADFLLEQGDPRGEFIALQLAGDAESSKRAEKLATKHGRQWLDGLTIAKNARFRRGFLSSVKATFKNQGEAEKYGALPAWATVEELELDSSNNANDQRGWGQTVPSTAVSLRRLSGINQFGFDALLARKTPLHLLETLEGYVSHFEHWRALTQSTLFPKLERVLLSGVQPAWFEKAPPPRAWRHFGMRFGELGTAYRAVSATSFETFTWDHRGWASLVFSRGEKGRLSRLELKLKEGFTPKVVKGSLDQLPDGCLEQLTLEGEPDETVKLAQQRLVRADGAALAEVKAPERLPGPALAIAAGEGGRVLWADAAGLVELDAKGKVLRDVAPARWSSAVFSSDGARVFGGFIDSIEVFDTRTGERLEKANVPCSTSYSRLSLSRDAKVLAAPMNPGVSVSWPGTTKKPVTYKGASSFALTPDGATLIRGGLTWGKGELQLHVVGEKARAVKLVEDGPEFTAIACAPDGATFLVADAEGELQLWSLGARERVKVLKGPRRVNQLAFSPDGKRFAAASLEGTWIFELDGGKKTTLEGGADALAWTKEGKLLRAVKKRLEVE